MKRLLIVLSCALVALAGCGEQTGSAPQGRGPAQAVAAPGGAPPEGAPRRGQQGGGGQGAWGGGQGRGGGPPGGAPSGPVEVGVVVLKTDGVARRIEIPGRVALAASANVRPQTEGIVRKILFKEGARVEAGAGLFEIDPGKTATSAAAAEAALSRARATLANAQAAYDRRKALAEQGFASAQDLATATATLGQARADVQSAEANLKSARISLGYATVRAPIAGVIGESAVNVGDLVTANQQTALAVIRQSDPVYVDLSDTSLNFLRLRQMKASGALKAGEGPEKAEILLETGEAYPHEATISLADMTVSPSTGALNLRATVPNPDGLLLPGMFVRGRMTLGTMPNAILVPQRAVQRDSQGRPTAYVVSAEGKAERRVLTTDGAQANAWIVTEGVSPGDKLIVDGFQKLSPGAAVKPVEATIDADGVVKQAMPPPPGRQAGAGGGGPPGGMGGWSGMGGQGRRPPDGAAPPASGEGKGQGQGGGQGRWRREGGGGGPPPEGAPPAGAAPK